MEDRVGDHLRRAVLAEPLRPRRLEEPNHGRIVDRVDRFDTVLERVDELEATVRVECRANFLDPRRHFVQRARDTELNLGIRVMLPVPGRVDDAHREDDRDLRRQRQAVDEPAARRVDRRR
jgi:hypothetical protein